MLHAKIIDLSKEKIKPENAEEFIASSKFGASIVFYGTVRKNNENKKVTGITYDSHDQLVIKSFKEIYNEADEKLNIKENISIKDLRKKIIHYVDEKFKGNENYKKIIKTSSFCSEDNNIISENYQITKDQKIGIIPPIGGG